MCLALEVSKDSSQNRVLIFLTSRPLTFQFQGVGYRALEVFKVFTQDKVRCSALLSRTFTIEFPAEVFKIFVPVRAQQRLPQFSPESRFKGFFELFQPKKSAEVGRQVGTGVVADSSSSTPAACGQATLADDDDGVDCFFEDDASNAWTRISKNTWVDPHNESWLHVRRRGAVYWWNFATQHT